MSNVGHQPQPHSHWEGRITLLLEETLECTTSDAQGIIEVHPFIMAQSWTMGLSPIDAAKRIIAASCTETPTLVDAAKAVVHLCEQAGIEWAELEELKQAIQSSSKH